MLSKTFREAVHLSVGAALCSVEPSFMDHPLSTRHGLSAGDMKMIKWL